MAARQFGLVVFRALAVYFLLQTLDHSIRFITFQTQASMMDDDRYFAQYRISSLSVLILHFLASAFLWTNADRLVGKEADDQPFVRSGNWVIRLVLSSLGILICLFSLDSLVAYIANFLIEDPIWDDRRRDVVIAMVVEAIRFFVGLALFIAYRFDKRAAYSAAQAIEEPEP